MLYIVVGISCIYSINCFRRHIMSFADKIRQNFKPQDNTKDTVSSEEIKNSATAFVTTIKQLLLDASKNGNVVQKKKNFFSTGKRVEYTTEFLSSEYTRVPIVDYFEDEPNYSYWNTPKDDKVSGQLFYGVVACCVLGIILGSFLDFQINEKLANVTKIGSFFAAFGCYFSYCLYPAAGMCLYKGLKKKGLPMAGAVLLIVGWFLAVYYTNSYSGSKVRDLFHYTAGESSPGVSVLSWLLIAALYVWPMIVCGKMLDDRDADKLIAVGAAILVAGIWADNVNLWLKQVASRPRYKYLLTLEDPAGGFRPWWRMIPNLAGSNDSFKSWPSGNMTIASMMFALPMVTDVLKARSEKKNIAAFALACGFVALYGYNRIHMTNHFLTDVCFGTLITCLIFAVVSRAFLQREKDAR